MTQDVASSLRRCEICGGTIASKPGYPAKVCSDVCRRIRNSQREQARYARIKHTPQWQETRDKYLESLKAKADQDPEFADAQRDRQRAAVQKYRDLLQQNPERLETYKEKQRQWFHGLSPERREVERERNRAWYASLTREEKVLHYYEARRNQALQRLLAVGEGLQKIKEKND